LKKEKLVNNYNSSARISSLMEAVKAEMAHEKHLFQEVLSTYSFQKKAVSGFLLYPLEILSTRYTIGDKVEVDCKFNKEISHKFKDGCGVKLFTKRNKEELEWNGVVSFMKKNSIRIILNNDNLSIKDLPEGTTYGLELIYDDRTYTIMLQTLNLLENKQFVYQNELLSKLLNEDRCEQVINLDINGHVKLSNLNEVQDQAIKIAANAQYLSIIHGPPGTGKTTTIVELIRTINKEVNKILVCAPSNTAVDILADRVNERQINVVRLGNITRVNDKNLEITLESLLRNHPEWVHIKKVKLEADEFERMASKFKRSFGEEERRERYHLQKNSRELRKWARELENRLIDKIIDEAKVICTTLIGSNNAELKNIVFDLVIIDEASQALEPECWTAILKAKKVILVGDHLQLPPTVKSNDAKKLGLETTFLDRFIGLSFHTSMLKEQYRMNKHIMAWPNQMFYSNLLVANEKVNSWHIGHLPPITFIDTAGTGFEEKLHNESQSYFNEGEYFVIAEHLHKYKEVLLGNEIGILSPYAEQVRYIRNQLREDSLISGLSIEVNSIDGFQGAEKDAIYLSLTRSNEKGNIGFLADERRINVAITRAKKAVIVIGDSSTLGNHTLFQSLLTHFEREGTYSSAWEYMSVG
jgi:ATP-dependent RNA/DNA helicase IGHMBP2